MNKVAAAEKYIHKFAECKNERKSFYPFSSRARSVRLTKSFKKAQCTKHHLLLDAKTERCHSPTPCLISPGPGRCV